MSSGSSRSRGYVEGLPEDRVMALMAYADGELEGAELEEVEVWLSTDVDAARFAGELATLGDLFEESHRGSRDAKAVASFDIADAVMAAIKGEEPAETGTKAPSVVSLDAARARRRKTVRAGGIAAAALALAASVFVMTRHKEERPMALAPVPAVHPSPSSSADPGVDVDVDGTEGESVRVFYLSNESSPTTSVVVWVDESGGK